MALRPSRLRRVLASPFFVLHVVASAVGVCFCQLVNVAQWLNTGYARHVYMVFVRLRRWSLGAPTYDPIDTLTFGFQPQSEVHRAIARADRRLVEVRCDCGKKTCKNPDGMFRVAPYGEEIDLPPEVKSQLADLITAEIHKVEAAKRDEK